MFYDIMLNQSCNRPGKPEKVREIEIDHRKPGKIRKNIKEIGTLLTIPLNCFYIFEIIFIIL